MYLKYATKDRGKTNIRQLEYYNGNIPSIRRGTIIESPAMKNLHIFASFSGTYLTIPTTKVMFSGNEHRSWIDITISSQTLHTLRNPHQRFRHSLGLEQYAIINTVPNVTDQVLVFNLGDTSNSLQEDNMRLTIEGKSHQKFRMVKTIHDNHIRYANFNLMLKWLVVFTKFSASDTLLSLQGESYQLKTHLHCKSKNTCPKLNVRWIPNQLNKYRDNKHNNPHKCLRLQQMHMMNETYCLNFSSSSTKQHYYVYITLHPGKAQDMFFESNEDRNIKKYSWNSASSLCQHMGGFLPIIRSKLELDEFIALIRFSEYIPPQDQVFIGLSTYMESKVT